MQKEKILLIEETNMYTIGQVSEMFSLPISTLRYYDKEGLFPQMERSSGIRRFSERELEALRVIECLKRSGLEIKEIKQFMQWCAEGSGTLTFAGESSTIASGEAVLIQDPGSAPLHLDCPGPASFMAAQVRSLP